MKRLLFFLVLVGMLIGGVSAADRIQFYDTQAFEYNVSPGYSIYQVSVNDLIDGETSIELDSYDQVYTIDVDCTHGAGWWTFNVTITFPDSSEYNEEVSSLAPFASDYDLKIQYIDGELDGLDADLFVYATPTVTVTLPAGWELLFENESILFFDSVSGTMPNEADVTIYIGTEEDIAGIEEGDLLGQLARTMGNIGSDIFAWSWEAILIFCEMIPVVGVYIAAILETLAALMAELFWYFNFFVIEEPEITFLTAECFILGHAITQGRSLIAMMRIIYNDHIKLFAGVVAVFHIMFDLVMRLVDFATSIINAMKPI